MYKAPPDKKLIKVSTPVDLWCFVMRMLYTLIELAVPVADT